VAGSLIALADWRVAFIAPGVIAVATGLVFALLHGRARGEARSAGAAARDSGVARKLAIRGLAVLALTSLCVGIIGQTLMVGLPKIFDVRLQLFGDGILGKSGMTSLVLAVGALGQLAGGYLADRFALKTVYVAMYVLIVPVALLATGAGDMSLVVAAGLMQMFMMVSIPTENSLVAHFCPSRWHATAYGAKFVMALGVSASAVPLVGATYDRTGDFFWLFAIVAALAALVALAGLLLPATRRTAPPPAPAGKPVAAE